MSAYNVLVADIKCSKCKKVYEGKIQFKFGDTWQLYYKVGAKIRWGGNDIGKSNLSKVKVYGILESIECPHCKRLNAQTEFDIFIEKDVIVKVAPMQNLKDYFVEDGNYSIFKE